MIVRQGAIYHFRRRVPQHLRPLLGKGELWHTLGTTSRRVAKARAAVLYALTEELFTSREGAVTEDEVKALAARIQEKLDKGEDVADLLMILKQACAAEAALVEAAKERKERLAAELRERRFVHEQMDANRALKQQMQQLHGRAQGLLRELLGRYAETKRANAQLTRIAEATVSVRHGPIPVPDATEEETSGPPEEVKLASAFVSGFLEDKTAKGRYAERTQRQAPAEITLFLKVAGDKPLAQYCRDDIVRWRAVLTRLPVHHGKSSRERHLSPEDVIAKADKENPNTPRLSQRTLKRYWTTITNFLRTANANSPAHQRFDPLILEAHDWDLSSPEAEKRKAWTEQALHALFHSFLYTGCAGTAKKHQRWRPGPVVVKDAYYWLPLLGVFTGCREEELARLMTKHVHQHFGVWVIQISRKEGRNRIKNRAAERLIPIHDELIRLGFLRYHAQIAATGADDLFPDLEQGPDGRVADSFCRFFTEYRRHIGIYERWMDFHSLRTTFTTQMLRDGHAILIVDELTGHDSSMRQEAKQSKEMRELRSLSVANYYTGAEMRKLKDAVNSFCPGVDLRHLYEKEDAQAAW